MTTFYRLPALLVLLCAAFLALTPPARAQQRPAPDEALPAGTTTTSAEAGTALLEVEDAAANQRLVLDEHGGLLVTGPFGNGTAQIPVEGPGTRLLWYPEKAAFRAGRASSTQWDDSNVGAYSTALGSGTTASGTVSTALGWGTTASGSVSTALGYDTDASGDYATALGRGTTASGPYATSLGYNTTASSNGATSLGFDTDASGAYATAMGYSTRAIGAASTALGQSTTASGDYATALGLGTTASGPYAMTMGYLTTASGHYTTAMGYGTTAGSEYATALGNNTRAIGSSATAMGRETTAHGRSSTALGHGTTARAYASLVIGRYNTVSGSTSDWISTDPLFVAGNGSSSGNGSSNALTLYKDGNLTIAGSLTESSDARLKHAITPIEDALALVERLRPVRYRFRAGTNRPAGLRVGLVAQEVEAVLPEVVGRDGQGYLSVAYGALSAVVAGAVQEQQCQIEALQQENAALQAELEALRQAVGTLQASVADRADTPAVASTDAQ